MLISTNLIVSLAVFIAALLYASAGHSGATAYLAIFGLVGLAPGVMKPAALSLNILVALVAIYKFGRAGYFSWRLLWPFALTSIPMAFLGGTINLTGRSYNLITGLVLLYAAYRMIMVESQLGDDEENLPPLWVALVIGALIGFVGGLIGIGGGVLLSPVLLLAGWAGPLRIAGVVAVFILVNSIAGLAGHWTSVMSLPAQIPYWGAAALAGGWIGATYGSQHFSGTTVRRLLGVVLGIASLKLILGL